MRSGDKSSLVGIVEGQDYWPDDAPPIDAHILHGSLMVYLLVSSGRKTFKQYFHSPILPYIQIHLQPCKRLDIVFDQYMPDSLKAASPASHGSGIQQKFHADKNVPSYWHSFLRVD